MNKLDEIRFRDLILELLNKGSDYHELQNIVKKVWMEK